MGWLSWCARSFVKGTLMILYSGFAVDVELYYQTMTFIEILIGLVSE